MIITTIVEKNEEGLKTILQAASMFCEERYLYAIFQNNMTKDEVVRLTSFVSSKESQFNSEILSLAKFANKWLDSYATDNNSCFDAAANMLNKIRGAISGAKIIYKKFCKRTRRQLPNVNNCSVLAPSENVNTRSVFKASELANPNYIDDFFGIGSYDDCVADLYKILEKFYREFYYSLTLCRTMLTLEAEKRNSSEIMDIYNKAICEMTKEAKELIEIYKGAGIEVPLDDLSKAIRDSDDRLMVIAGNYHALDKKTMKMHVARQLQEKSKSTGLTVDEHILWPNQPDNVIIYRNMAQHYDEISPKNKDGKLNSYEVAAFMSWTGIKENENKTTTFAKWLRENYRGQYALPAANTLNKAKNKVNLNNADNHFLDKGSFDVRLDELATKYNHSPKNILDDASITFN